MNHQLVSECNSQGAAALEARQIGQSIAFFKAALHHTFCALQTPQVDASVTTSTSTEDEPCTQPQDAIPSRPPPTTVPVDDSHQDAEMMMTISQSSPTTVAFVHSQALYIHPQAYSPDPLVHASIVSSILLFNLAVAYHLLGLSVNTPLWLAKAGTLYQKSQQVLADAAVPVTVATGHAVVDLMSLALHNNCAHICHEVGQFDQARAHFEQLVSLAVTVLPDQYGCSDVAQVLEQQKSNFLLNAIILQPPQLAPAA